MHRRYQVRKAQLEELVSKHGKICGYCKCRLGLTSSIELDDYRPRSKYPELEMDLENKVISCSFCNRSKGGIDPIFEDGKVVILNPYKEEYSKHMQVDDLGCLQGITDEGISTIQLLKLNRPELVEYRQNNVSEFLYNAIDSKASPYDIYKSSIDSIKELININNMDEKINKYFLRMLYANIIALMESYLSKIMIVLIYENDELKWNCVKKFDWGKEKIELNNLKESYDNIDIKVQNAISEVLYHNLPKVRIMYKEILNISILTNQEDLSFLSKAVDIRHDIVHRNGRCNKATETEEKYHEITKEIISELLVAVQALVDNIENQVNEKEE